MLVLACVSIILPLNSPTKVVNLFPSTLMMGMDREYAEFHVPALHDSVHSCHIHFILHICWIQAGETPCCLHVWRGRHLTSARTRIPCYPAHTLVSNIDYTLYVWYWIHLYTYPYISRHNKNGIPKQQRKIKTLYTKIYTTLYAAAQPSCQHRLHHACVCVCIYIYINMTSCTQQYCYTGQDHLTYRCTLPTDLFVKHGNQALKL